MKKTKRKPSVNAALKDAVGRSRYYVASAQRFPNTAGVTSTSQWLVIDYGGNESARIYESREDAEENAERLNAGTL